MNARQTTLFDILPGTSMAAGKKAFKKAWYFREKIHAFILSRGAKGATRHEIEVALSPTLGIRNNSICPRVLELIRRGMVTETAEMRKTASGCNAHVLIARASEPTNR